MTATSEPVTNPSHNMPSSSQNRFPAWQVRRSPPVYTRDAHDVYNPANNRPNDPRHEAMEDRQDQAPSMPPQYPGYRHFHWKKNQTKNKLDQANKVADLISNRNFEGLIARPLDSTTTTYSLLLGGATFLALTGLASATGIRGPLGNFLGRRIAHLTLTAAAGAAAGTVGLRYQVQHQTLNDLKILGTYMAPDEPSPSADALCQHPIVVQALMHRKTEQEEQRQFQQHLQRAGYHHDHSHRHGQRRWEDSGDFSFRTRGTKHQILTELDHVLDHFEVRRELLSKTSKSRQEPANVQ